MSELAASPAPDTARRPSPPHLGWVLAGLSGGAGAIHLAMVPAHAGDSLVDPIGFAVVGWFQVLVAVAIVADRAGRNLYRAAVLGNLAVLGLWLWSRTVGLPVGAHAGVADDVTVVDGTAALLQVGAVVVGVRLLLAPVGARLSVGIAPALLAVAALGLSTVVITSDEASGHGGDDHSHGDEAAHAHGDDDHATLMADLDAARCDLDLNIPAYWAEAEAIGVDTYQGGAMATGDHAHTGDDPATATTQPDPLGGRGSLELDALVSATDAAGGGETAAADLVVKLAEADDATYDAWLWWMRSVGAGEAHDHDAAAPDDSGHGGHAGPQPWVAMTDQAECDQLAEELELARDTALAHPTAADAIAAGYVRVTPYVPGIAAHYMNGSYVDGTFEIDKPEMILYDGNGEDARVVGLSYYVVHEGDAEPTQGFTGPNDHYHRHVGLCIGAGGVIGDSTTTDEECAARGGRKAQSTNGWMSHAWVVPGCESPWGLFSGATPVLDRALAETSGEDGGGCAGSSVRDRYGLDTAPVAQPTSAGG